ncbi:MAG: hypothetical protein K2M65_01080, partial [Muribaculaceae bacterium]|nr:hypothetical protein [Muribaculaceae bacterium]
DIRVTDLPLENESSKFCFDFEAPVRILTSVDDHPLDIPIPTFQNKEAGLYGRTVRYDFSVTGNVDFEPTIDKSVRVSLQVPAKSKRRYFLYIEHMRLKVPVRLKIKHPVSGRQRDLTGKLTVTEPSRFFYGYQDVTDNE